MSYEGLPPTLTEMADAIESTRTFLRAFIAVNGGDPQERTLSFCRTAHDLLKMLDGMLPPCPRCKGTKRVIDYRGTAVREIDYRAGYTIEFAPSPEQHAALYDDLEEALKSGEAKPLPYNWHAPEATLGQDWETMPCSCRTGKLSLFDAVGMAGELVAPVEDRRRALEDYTKANQTTQVSTFERPGGH